MVMADNDSEDIVAQYIQRHAPKNASQGNNTSTANDRNNMQVYVKPQMDDEDNWFSATKRNSQNPKSRSTSSQNKISVPDLDASTGNGSGPRPTGKPLGQKTKKSGKGVSLAEAQEGKLFISRGAPCSCQATRHRLVNNCLSCGKIICEQEGEGPCNFCGALVLAEGSTYAGLEGTGVPMSDSEAAALAFKNRLVEYGRNSSQRTTVIDDQSDYFQFEESKWLSEEEKQEIRKRQEEIELQEEARKKKLVVSIDLLGRKVVMAGDEDSDINIKTSILDGIPLFKPSNENDTRIKPNPYLQENPVFLDVSKSKSASAGTNTTSSGRREIRNLRNEILGNTGRVQHDDPFISALNTLEDSHKRFQLEAWKAPKLKEQIPVSLTEDDECSMGSEAKNLFHDVFDICPPTTGKRHTLSPSTLAMRQAERKHVMGQTSPVNILQPGLVLLKNWLPQHDQVEIVRKCRDLGMRPGGFYQPAYGSDSKLHLWMMCLGMHWDPNSKSYQMKRPFDNATPPRIPGYFTTLADRYLQEAKSALETNEGRKNNGTFVLPDMRPDICLVNFYENSGRLGLHQDKDESQESLQKGLPIVSFSIGDSAEFLYGMNRDEDSAESVILESGDVLIFGGPSRMIYHGVRTVLSQTAPSWLIEKTNLRPGRLNLTFRQI